MGCRGREAIRTTHGSDDGGFDKLEAGKYRVVLGSELAHTLGVTVGDKVFLRAAGVKPIQASKEYTLYFELGKKYIVNAAGLLNTNGRTIPGSAGSVDAGGTVL